MVDEHKVYLDKNIKRVRSLPNINASYLEADAVANDADSQ